MCSEKKLELVKDAHSVLCAMQFKYDNHVKRKKRSDAHLKLTLARISGEPPDGLTLTLDYLISTSTASDKRRLQHAQRLL